MAKAEHDGIMTALSDYQRLEATGIWHASPEEQRRDVILTLGDATLTIVTAGGQPLSHWSLPAIERINPGEDPAMYRPGPESGEVLEVGDEAMVAAIERVRRSVAKRRPKPGRLRGSLIFGSLAVLGLLMVFWLPDALKRQAAAMVPVAVRDGIGQALLLEVERFAGAPCETVHGSAALARLHARLLPGHPGRITVLPGGARMSGVLPGGIILLNRDLVEDYETPEVAAGHVLAEALGERTSDPLRRLLDQAGVMAAGRLMVTGTLGPDVIPAYAEELMLSRGPLPGTAALLAAFDAARVSPLPFAQAVDPNGEATLGLTRAGPGTTNELILSDTDWVALQGICEG